MTYTHSTLVMAMLSVLSNGCAHSASPDCAPASINYPDIAKDETSYYLVKKDDTLYAISRFFALDYRQLAQWNRIEPPAYTIGIGQKIRLSDPVWGNKPTQEGSTPLRMQAVEQLPSRLSENSHKNKAAHIPYHPNFIKPPQSP
ncbi:MAG: LysM peptidoglycan-binding domain-containing protein [Methylococcaceae bacterium]